jgi:hypothetical protein
MLQTTIEAMKAILGTDSTVDKEQRQALMEIFRSGIKTEGKPDRVLRRKEAACRLGVTVKALDLWKRKGIVKPVIIGGSSRAIGFRESDIERLMA